MSLFGTFERALIWQGTREMFYQARRRRQRTPRSTAPVPRQHPASDEVLVTFECASGHRFTRSFEDSIPNERQMAGTRCPECKGTCHWLTFDYHKENDGQPARW
jgi:hypothetical protein